jgi:membrane-associated protease RseP (regulator of RpoE activity)
MGPQKPSGTLGPLRPPRQQVLLFLLTAISIFVAGDMASDDDVSGLAHLLAWVAWRLGLGLPVKMTFSEALPSMRELLLPAAFSAALLAILLAHEFGHFFAARWHKVDAGWPTFLPAPIISFVGTFGAVIRLREVPRTRRALLHIGVAGPLAGFLVALPLVYVGLKLSSVVPAGPRTEPWILWEAALDYWRRGEWPSLGGSVDLGEPLLFQLCERLVFGAIPEGQSVKLHLVGVAAWFGLLVTSLNLLPLGQLDGGHVLQALSPRLHRTVGPPLSALFLALGIFTPFVGWALWGLLTGTVLSRHPAVAEPEERLTPGQRALAVASLATFVFSFTPVPLALLLK